MKIKNVYTNKPLVVTPISERFYELADDVQIFVQTDEGRMLYELKKGVRTNFRSGCAGVDLFVDHIGNVNTQLAYLVHDMNYCILPSEWHHFAITSKFVGKRNVYSICEYGIFLDGKLLVNKSGEVYLLENYVNFRAFHPDNYYVSGNCKAAFSQITLRKGIKYTGDFTPSRKPYFLGE